MKSYINNSGKKIVIADMPGPYLLNSYSYYNARLVLLRKGFGKRAEITEYYKRLKNQVDSLWSEIQKRNLLTSPS